MNKSSEQLEREAEQSRADLAATLEELRSRMTPGQVFDEVVGYARDGMAGEFVGNLRQQLGRNPIPTALAGLGLAWLMVSAGRATRRGPSAYNTTDEWGAGARDIASRGWDTSTRSMRGMGESVSDAATNAADSTWKTAREMREGASETMGKAADSTRRTVHDLRDKISGVAESATDTARSAANRLGEKAKAAGAAFGDMAGDAQSRMSSAYDSMSRTASGAASSGRGLFDFVREQPLVLAGIGLAIGAALGAALPVTRTENELMGEKADALKERMGEMASEQYEKAQEVAGSAYEHAKKEAEQKFGLQPGQQPGGESGEKYKSAEMPAVTENVSTAPSGNENAVPRSDETAQRQEELGFAESKPNR